MRYINFFCLFLLILSCADKSNEELSGLWKAKSVVRNDQPLNVNLSEITLEFDGEERYEYKSTLNYKEAGFYKFHKDRLETQDTLLKSSAPKVVIVESLILDTLRIKMKSESDWMYLTLERD